MLYENQNEKKKRSFHGDQKEEIRRKRKGRSDGVDQVGEMERNPSQQGLNISNKN